ncbi:MarR family transcriptional regulator [Streptomyces sp. NA04227]|nr:MarR family transcriptional regulator [Streptomyces sp. NA04227]
MGHEGSVAAEEAEELALAVLAVSRLFTAASLRSLASVDDSLTLPQLRSLVVLDRGGPMKLASLAAALGVIPSTALRMVERLEAQQLARRVPNPGNRREVVLQMSARGRAVVDEVMRRRNAELCALVEHLPPDRRPALVASLRALAAGVEGTVEGPDGALEAAGGSGEAHAGGSGDANPGGSGGDAYEQVRRVGGLVDDPLDPTLAGGMPSE